MGCTHLVELQLLRVREVQGGQEEMHELAAQPGGVDVAGQQLAEEILPRAGPAVQRQGQRLLGAGVVAEARHCPQHHLLGQVLPEQPLVQLLP